MSQHPLACWSLSTTDILRQLQMAKAFAYHKQEAYTIAQRLSCIAGTIPTRRNRNHRFGKDGSRPGGALGKARPLSHVQLLSKRSYRIVCEKLDQMLAKDRWRLQFDTIMWCST